MATMIVALLIFIGMVGIGLIAMQPIMASYTQNYMMRVRYSTREVQAANKSVDAKSFSLVGLCKTIGYATLKAFPKLGQTQIKQALSEANFRSPDHLAILTGTKVLCSGVFVFLIAVQSSSLPYGYVLIPVVGFFAWTLPNYSVLGKAKTRNNALLMELPTLLDLVAVCSKAGMGLVGCLDKVAKEMKETCPVVAEELDQLLVDIKVFARPLHQALIDMAARCGVEELENLTSALIIADQKGADISSTLQKQSLALRERIKRKAEEKLSTAPVKMVPVTIFFILPLMMVPTLGPPAMLLIDALKQLGSQH
jgi:tight adherence protein C